jgi:succinoglycan biosynthesis transport protein ExoP
MPIRASAPVPPPHVLPVITPVAPAATHRGVMQQLDLRHLWHVILRRLWVIVVCCLAGLFLALGYLARTPKTYQSHLGLEVEFQEPSNLPGEQATELMRSTFLASQESLRTIEETLTSPTLLARVIRSENLASDGGISLLGRNIAPAPAAAASEQDTNANSSLAGLTYTRLEQRLATQLSEMVKASIRRGTRLIDVYVDNRDPVVAQRIAEAIGREYIRQASETRQTASHESLRYLMEEETRLKAELQKSEAAVADYKARTPDALQLGGGVAATGAQPSATGATYGGVVENKLQDINNRLATARAERQRLEHEMEQIDQANGSVDALLAVPGIATAPVVADRRRDIAQIESAAATLAQRYKQKHPKMIAAQAALEEAKRGLREAVLQQPAVVRNTLDEAKTAEANLQNTLHGQEQAALALNKATIGYQELARQAETDRALYESVLRQIKSTDVAKGAKATPVVIVDKPVAPLSPYKPRPALTIAFGALAGIMLGFGIVLGLDLLDRSIKTVDAAETSLGLPVLAAVPDVSKTGGKDRRASSAANDAAYRLVAEAPEGPAAEAFRNLRATLSLSGSENERRVVMFTSAIPGEGKSFSSANYALSLAQQGHRVLLMDSDLRRPSLHKIFQPTDTAISTLRQQNRGVVDCLIGDISLREAAQAVAADEVDVLGDVASDRTLAKTARGGQLSILAGGTQAPNPAELLSGPAFAQLVADAARAYDRVVIDSAPILAVSDSLLMAPHVQKICIVVRAAYTARNAVERALALLGTTGKSAAGIVLNRLPQSTGAGYYYHYASYGYGAGEGSYMPRSRRSGSVGQNGS